MERSPGHTDALRSLRKENSRLNKELARWRKATGELHEKLGRVKERAESIRETGKKLSRENLRLHREVRVRRDAEARALRLSDENFWLRHALEVSKHGQKKLTARIAKLRAAKATRSKLPLDEAAQLRTVLRRSRRQKTTIERLRKDNARLRKAVRTAKAGRASAEERLAKLRAVRKTLSTSRSGMDTELRRVLRRSRRQKSAIKSLSRENTRLRRTAKGSRNRIEALEGELAKLRSTGAVLSRRLYGRKSEQQKKPRSERKRGQQHGAPGHGRTQRPGLEERPEELTPPPDACVCTRCGQPYAPNGAEESTLVEIEVIVYKRVIQRQRWRRTCECASSPMEVSASPAPRLFRGTPYGISVWARLLFELCVCLRPGAPHRGMDVGPGADDLAGNAGRQPEALRAAVRAAVRGHPGAPEQRGGAAMRTRPPGACRSCAGKIGRTGPGCGPRSATTRSASTSMRAVAPRRPRSCSPKSSSYAVIICDRYSAYKKLARMLGGLVTLAFCWSHVRRDFIDCAAGQPSTGAMVPGMDRADRRDLPVERGAAEASRPWARAPDAGVRHGAGRAGGGARHPVRAGRTRARRPARQGARGQGATLAREPPRGAVCLRRPARSGPDEQCRRTRAARSVNRPTIELRFRQREGRGVHRDHVLGRRHALDERHRCPALAGDVAGSLCGQWSPAARRLVALVAVVDERGAKARVHGAGMTGTIECRYYGRDFTPEEMALLRALIAGPSGAQPPCPVEGVLPAHRLAQARRRAQGHDGAGHQCSPCTATG